MGQEVEIERTLLPAPTPDNPERQVYQIEYRVGDLPPHFIYIDKVVWTKQKEKEEIQADIAKRMGKKREIIEL